MLEDTVLTAASFKSLLSEVLDWSSVLHNSKFRVPGKAATPVITIVCLCIYFCVHSFVNIRWESMVPSQWSVSEIATSNCTALGGKSWWNIIVLPIELQNEAELCIMWLGPRETEEA